MSPKRIEIKKRTISALLLEEFARPSIRRQCDGHQNQETEICGLEKTIHRQADGPDPRAGSSGWTGALRHRRGRLRQTAIEMDAVQLLWQRKYRADERGPHHETPIDQAIRDLQEAFAWLPKSAYAEEAKPLAELARKKRRGLQRIGDLMIPLLIRLGVPLENNIESPTSEARSSD
jgi:hypothetical protein